MESRRHFTPLVLSANGFTGREAWADTLKMVSPLSFKLKREYSEMCDFVGARMTLPVVQSNTLFLRVPCDREAQIRQHPELSDRAVIALLVTWRG